MTHPTRWNCRWLDFKEVKPIYFVKAQFNLYITCPFYFSPSFCLHSLSYKTILPNSTGVVTSVHLSDISFKPNPTNLRTLTFECKQQANNLLLFIRYRLFIDVINIKETKFIFASIFEIKINQSIYNNYRNSSKNLKLFVVIFYGSCKKVAWNIILWYSYYTRGLIYDFGAEI